MQGCSLYYLILFNYFCIPKAYYLFTNSNLRNVQNLFRPLTLVNSTSLIYYTFATLGHVFES